MIYSPTLHTTHTHTLSHTIALDQNDNAPRFDPINYIFNVPENTDFVSLAIRATDDDLGPNSVITYDIAGGNVDYAFVIGELSCCK